MPMKNTKRTARTTSRPLHGEVSQQNLELPNGAYNAFADACRGRFITITGVTQRGKIKKLEGIALLHVKYSV